MTTEPKAAGQSDAAPDYAFIGGFAPATPPEPLHEPEPAKEEPKAPEPAKEPEPPKPDPAAAKLAESIRRDREERAAKQAEAKRQADLETELRSVREELSKLKGGPAPEDDIVGYVKSRKLSPETQLLLGQSLLWDLAPDKAPADFRFKLFEDRQKRTKAQEEAAKKEAEAKQAIEAQQQALESFASTLEQAARGFTPGTYPESEAWFGDEHSNYARSLMATAQNLAKVANERGQVADLRPESVARVLETEVAKRMAARDARRAGASKKEAEPLPKEPARGKQPVEDTTSTRGLNGGGSPEPKAMTDAERIQRAIKAGFRSR